MCCDECSAPIEFVGGLDECTDLLNLRLEELWCSKATSATERTTPFTIWARPHAPISATHADAPLRSEIVGKKSIELHAAAFPGCRKDFGQHAGISNKMLVETVKPDPWQIGSIDADFYSICHHGFGSYADPNRVPFVVFGNDRRSRGWHRIWRAIVEGNWRAAEGAHSLVEVE